MLRKKIIATVITTSCIISMSVPVHATGVTERYQNALKEAPSNVVTITQFKSAALTDISSHWGKANIEKLVSLNAIAGYPDGTFRPNNTITRAEFLKIALLAVDNTISTAKTSDHWASGILEAAYDKDIVRPTEIPMTSEALNQNITRYEMARIMVRINEGMQKEAEVGTFGIGNIMPDYNSLPQTYRAYVEQAYMKGLLAGNEDGSFRGSNTGTRAEASTMVLRLIDATSRVKVDTSKPQISAGQKILNQMPTYTKDMGAGLQFNGVGYTVEDAALFAKNYLIIRSNYDGTNQKLMDIWEQKINTYYSTQGAKGTSEMKQRIIANKDVAISEVYVDASKIEIKDGLFNVHGVVTDKVGNKTYKVDFKIGSHDINKSDLVVFNDKWTAVN